MNKKFFIIMMVSAIVCLATLCMAGTPFRETVTMTAGSGSMTYSKGINNAAFFAWKIDAIVFGGTATTTQTVSTVDANITNQIATKAISATDRVLMVTTNDSWHFVNDKVLITSSDTNTHTAYVIGEEL